MSNLIGVKLRKRNRATQADAGDLQVKLADKVLVETSGGISLAEVVPRPGYTASCACKNTQQEKVIGFAEDTDIRQEELNIRMERDYFQLCQKKISKHNLQMKLVDVEIVPDGTKVVFYFVAENRVDFRQLVKELASDLRTRIEMRQIGARSEAQRIGALGCCGRELCCSTFLQKFAPVTVKMTKEQGLPLDPEKISGVCGRLMCCLAYEYENYVEMRKGLPKIGKRLQTPQGIGKIRQINVLSRTMLLEMEDRTMTELKLEDYKPDMLVKK
jgi:cell fate regulator YaaT (PSP1 superfamily)